MNQTSKYFASDFGKIHYESPNEFDPSLPTVLFFHGGSPASQHTGFWDPLKGNISRVCNPVYTDRFGHGKSKLTANDQKIGLKDHLLGFTQFIDELFTIHDIEQLFIVGRSAGGAFALRLLEYINDQVTGLLLIAPASLANNAKYFDHLRGKLIVFWDVNDPVVKFSNYQMIKNLNLHHELYTVGSSPDATRSISHEGIKSSHSPELLAPDFFAKALGNLIR